MHKFHSSDASERCVTKLVFDLKFICCLYSKNSSRYEIKDVHAHILTNYYINFKIRFEPLTNAKSVGRTDDQTLIIKEKVINAYIVIHQRSLCKYGKIF